MSFLEILGKTDLGPVGVALIEKISAGIAALTKPVGTIVDAWTAVQAGKIRAVGDIEIEAAKQRAIERHLSETMMQQKHLESIYGKTYALVENDPEVTPESIRQIEDDWVSFHSARASNCSGWQGPAEIPNYLDYCKSVWQSRGIYTLPERWDFERDGILLTGGNAPDGSPPDAYLKAHNVDPENIKRRGPLE